MIHHFKLVCINEFYRIFIYPKIKEHVNHLHVHSINYTIKSLINTNRSLTRFGDGEMRRVVGHENLLLEKADRFEKNSSLLRHKLIMVLKSNLSNLEIGLPSAFGDFAGSASKRFYRLLIAKYGKDFLKYLNYRKSYYNTGFSRFYIESQNKKLSRYRFKLLKKIWNNKKILIVEGNKCRIGLGNNLFSNVKWIKRIECPSTNAFEQYDRIFESVINFLKHNQNVLTLISLGPSATILVYDLVRYGYRAIDIGQVDVEYEWYLLGVSHKVNISNRYISEVPNGQSALPIHSTKFLDEIISYIK